MLAKLTHGRPKDEHRVVAALTPYEYAAWAPLIALTVLVGLWPKLLLELTNAPVRALLGGG
jgi:NADH-quinone oxidoreductase subunit M